MSTRGGNDGGGRGRGRGRGRGGRSDSGGRGRGNVGTGDLTVKNFPSVASSSQTYVASSSQTSAASLSSSKVMESSTSGMDKLQITEEKKNPEMNLPPASSKGLNAMLRPEVGKQGDKVLVCANHFHVVVADRDLYHYDVSISPEVISKKVNREVIENLIETYQSHLDRKKPAYDGRKSLYTAGALPFESKDFVVTLKETRAGGSVGKERQFKVTIKFASKPDIDQVYQFLLHKRSDYPYEVIQGLDVVLRDGPSNKFVTIGRSFFSPNLGRQGIRDDGIGELGYGVQYWKGYFQSLRLTHMGFSLNVDVSARSFYDSVLVTDFVRKFLDGWNLNRPLRDSDRVKVRKVLKSLKVKLVHWNLLKSLKVTGISNRPIRELSFTLEDGTETTVIQYFADKYNYRVQYPALPAIQSGNDARPTYTPMELCKIAEGQRYTKRLTTKQVIAMIRATCQRPNDRQSAIKEMVKNNDYNKIDLVSKEFGMSVKEDLTLIEARVLKPPVLKYHGDGRGSLVTPEKGKWSMHGKKMYDGATIGYWTSVNFSNAEERRVQGFCSELIKACNKQGMHVNERPCIPHVSYWPENVEEGLHEIHDKAKGLQLLIVILPDNSGLYGKIKRICETELGIVSQCCLHKHVEKWRPQYFENVALKINVKAGGRNTVLNDAFRRNLPLVSDNTTIIMGADVTHPQPGEDSSPSIAAVVASMDWPEITKYRALVSAQAHREEIIQDLYKLVPDNQGDLIHAGMIREHLLAFHRSTNLKPERIIFYRDGVSEGQFSQVLLHEVTAIRRACNSIEKDYLPRITFVIVKKRHHTRLFPAEANASDINGNIHPGTVVDTDIVHPTEFDFFLNSHAGIQGTNRPAHYHVLLDENNFSADVLQMITNNLCYTFARCTRSVSIVPPAYYAHLAAFRARHYMEIEMSDGVTSRSRNTEPGVGQVALPLPEIKNNVKNVMFFC